MHQANVSFAKIVATPTTTAWSQAYNAGSLFTVLSLTTTEETDVSLTTLGKDIINNLEAEFFTLETKSLSSIQQAVTISLHDIPPHIQTSLVLAYIKESILYLLIYGSGLVTIKRDNILAPLLQRTETTQDFISASGYLKQHDIIILQTKQFTELIKPNDIQQALDLQLPNDIAEMLSPKIHNAENGGASAIILAISGVPQIGTHTQPEEQDLSSDGNLDNTLSTQEQTITKKSSSISFSLRNRTRRLSSFFHTKFRKKTLLLLSVTVILLSLLTFIIFSTLHTREEARIQKDFTTVYEQINRIYIDAIGIKMLNPNQARADLQSAKKMLVEKVSTFPKDSKQESELRSLEQKIDSELESTLQSHSVNIEKTNSKDSPLLEAFLNNADAISITEDEDAIYILTTKNVLSINKSTKKESPIIKNNNDWNKATAISTYNGNIYILDKEKGVLKFVPAKNGYAVSSYFSDTPPDLSQAVSMAIDGSLWILYKDGTLKKFTKGKQEAFTFKNIDAPFVNPNYVALQKDTPNLYILDNEHSRIVQFSKDGTYKSQYSAEKLKTATIIDVKEAVKKIYLINNKEVLFLTLP